jgi:hypothetical protein
VITIKIDVTKITKNRLFEGKNGAKYLNIVLIETPNDKYGNDFMIVEETSKEEREAGKRGTILGNAKNIARKPHNASQPQLARSVPSGPQRSAEAYLEDQDVPF